MRNSPNQPESANFDPYYKWLGIPPAEQPPNHYRLLGVDTFESDLDVIENAAEKQAQFLRARAIGKHSTLTQELLSKVMKAQRILLNEEERQQYDQQLAAQMKKEGLNDTGSRIDTQRSTTAEQIQSTRSASQKRRASGNQEKPSVMPGAPSVPRPAAVPPPSVPPVAGAPSREDPSPQIHIDAASKSRTPSLQRSPWFRRKDVLAVSGGLAVIAATAVGLVHSTLTRHPKTASTENSREADESLLGPLPAKASSGESTISRFSPNASAKEDFSPLGLREDAEEATTVSLVQRPYTTEIHDGYFPVSTSILTVHPRFPDRKLEMQPLRVDGVEPEEFFFIHPNQESDPEQHTTVSISLPEGAYAFEALYIVNHTKSDGVDIRASVTLSDGSFVSLPALEKENFGARGGQEKIQSTLPARAQSLVFTVGQGAGDNNAWDHFYLVKPMVKCQKESSN